MTEPNDFSDVSYLSVALADGSTYAVEDNATMRHFLTRIVSGRFADAQVLLMLAYGGTVLHRASDIMGFGPNTPETRTAHRAFNKAIGDEDEEKEEWGR